MACRLSLTEEDFCCPICYDIFRDPVLLACSHSICNICVKTFWNRRGTQDCPICRTVSSNPNPPINIVLRNMCDLMREETTQEPPVETVEVCSLHGEPLTFFCTEDQELVCGKCRNAKSHKNHRIRSTEDASQELKQELQLKLKAFLEKLRVYEQIKQSWDETEEYIKKQSQNTETQIKEAFDKLHQFLETEEAARTTALKKEEEQKTPVTFDPNTAHPYLLVSDDLTSITYSDEHFPQLPANPERFDGYTSILGSEGFNSGTHCWDIEVGDSTAWAVGVITESAYKHRQTPSKTGLWYVGFCNGKYGKGCSPQILTLLRVTQRIQRIRVQLDWDKGKVTFTDSGRDIGLHMFKHRFTERVFPYFYSHCMQQPMRIIPIKTTVEVHM
ncbi:hypothetical protein cypCar_00032471 [Cyprinus carpio]|nr:hypothetical protein cypCar_00032471 [Cyprinus carpio]